MKRPVERKEDKTGRRPPDLILELYSNLMVEIWEVVSALIGEAILALLFNLAVQKVGKKYPFLMSMKISEEGISLEKVIENCRDIPPSETHRGFQSLANHLFHLFSILAEGVINKELL